MDVISRSLGLFRTRFRGERGPSDQELMQDALRRVRTAELQLQEATSLEELDIARAALQSCHAELQQLIRTVKRDRGITLRPIAETEEMHRNLRDFLNRRSETLRTPMRRKASAGRV